jgi:hypothetical protein
VGEEVKRLRSWSWETTTGLCCFSGGIVAATVGSVLTAITWIVGGDLHPWVRGIGTALLVVTIPLLIFSGYCLDWGERKQARWQRHQG